MKFEDLDLNNLKVYINKIVFDNGKYYFYIDLIKTGGLSNYLFSIVSDKTTLDGESGINSILSGIKDVTVTFEEFQERKKRDDEIRANGFVGYDWEVSNALYFHIEDANDRSIFTPEQISKVPYMFSSEAGFAYCYKDITEVTNLDGNYKEYYHTSEVIEVLEKWKEALERWNNLEERAKMIETYERENIG